MACFQMRRWVTVAFGHHIIQDLLKVGYCCNTMPVEILAKIYARSLAAKKHIFKPTVFQATLTFFPIYNTQYTLPKRQFLHTRQIDCRLTKLFPVKRKSIGSATMPAEVTVTLVPIWKRGVLKSLVSQVLNFKHCIKNSFMTQQMYVIL